MDSPQPKPTSRARPWLFPVALVLLLALMAAWRRAPRSEPAAAPDASAAGSVVIALEVSGDAAIERDVPWGGGDALAALQAAGAESPAFVPEVRGSGAGALVTAIGGVGNEGAGGRNWTYSINGVPGDRSAAVANLSDGDRVLWTFDAVE